MVYESDFYTTRRPYSSRPTVTSYSVTRREVPWHLVPTVPRPSQVPLCYTAFGCKGLPTPRHYVVLDTPDRPRRAEEQYSYSYSQESSDTRYDSSPYSVPSRTYSSSSERVSRSTGSGPGNYSYTTERSSRSSDQPGGYHSSYSSSTSGRLPHGTTYRHYSYRALKEFDDDDDFGYPYPPFRAQPYHRNIPYIGHKRLVVVQPSAHGWRVKQSSLLGEIDRIYHKVRPSLAYQPKEDYLNSRSIMSFDDETRQIRAKTADILKKIHTPVPRSQRPLPLPGDLYYSHTELPITDRIISDHYIDRLLSSVRPLPPVTLTLSQYEEPRQYGRLGKSHLACLTYAGGRPILRRKNLASVEDYIRDDINVLSHYSRFRQAAEKAPHVPDTEYGSIPHRPPTKSPVTGSWKSNAPRRAQSDKVFTRSADGEARNEFEDTQERKKKKREEMEAEAMKEAEDEKRRAQELKRQEELAEQAAVERQQELERKAREEEEERVLREEVERQEALKKAKEEEKRAREEEEARIAKELEERKAREEEERRIREEEERIAREEEERKIKEEEERKIKEEEERRIKEEEERRIKEEELLAREEEERRLEEELRAEEERIAEEEERQKALEEKKENEEEEEKPEELTEEPQIEETAELKAEESGNEPVIEEPLSPVETTEAPAEGGEDEDEEEDEEEEEGDEE